jgi:aryl-alcohol dehydrogenase-like predicted oxidoreductase
VDLLLVHWPNTDTPFEETMGALNDIVTMGKARYIGVSNFRASQLRTCATYAPIAVNQVGYSMFDRRWEHEVFSTARSLGISIMAYGPLAHGLLTGTFTADTVFASTDWRSQGDAFGQPLFAQENFVRNVSVTERLKSVAEDIGTTLPCLAVASVPRRRYHLRMPGQPEESEGLSTAT